MKLVLVTGGARSGKSRWAAAEAARLGADAVSFVATGRVTDDEMARRIALHRAERPAAWETVEAEADAAAALASARHDVVLLDCLTFVVADALMATTDRSRGLAEGAPVAHRQAPTPVETPSGGGSAAPQAEEGAEAAGQARVQRAIEALLAAAGRRAGTLLVVTNEVGMGVVPATPLGRWFRDAQGWANQRVAAVADEVVLMACGLPLRLKG